MNAPKDSMWGKVQHVKFFDNDSFCFVETASHGGYMIPYDYAKKHLSIAARQAGVIYYGYICYEEDCKAGIIMYELKKHVEHPFQEEKLMEMLEMYEPKYFEQMCKKA